jgi:hypothetical protein
MTRPRPASASSVPAAITAEAGGARGQLHDAGAETNPLRHGGQVGWGLLMAGSFSRDSATPATRRGALLVACAAMNWSTGGLIARLVTTSPWTTSLWRSVFASLFLALVLRMVRGHSLPDHANEA